MISGSIVALVTPMHSDGSLDQDSLADLLEWHIEQGTDAIVSMGTTGESATLDVKEHTEVIAFTVDRIKGRIPVIAGTGANATWEAIELTQQAKEVGADGCLLVTPYYNKPTQEGLYQHYTAIADAVAIPQILYNVPGRTACDMLPETIVRLAKHPQIMGVKEATGDVSRIAALKAHDLDDFVIFTGDDGTMLEAFAAGAQGNISVTANIAPQAMHDACWAALKGDMEGARAINANLLGLHNALFVEANPIPVKWALSEMGRMEAGIRLPLTPLSDCYHEQLRAALSQAQCLQDA